MSYYQHNKRRARIKNTDPTLTDQSQAKETDINVIIGRYNVSKRVPGATTEPFSGDFTRLPTDLRGFLEEARTLNARRSKLPKELQELTLEALMALTPETLQNKLTPPAPPPAEHKEETK